MRPARFTQGPRAYALQGSGIAASKDIMSTANLVRLTTLLSLVAGALWMLNRDKGPRHTYRLDAARRPSPPLQPWEAGKALHRKPPVRRAFLRPVISW